MPGARATRLDGAHGTWWAAWRADALAANLSRAAGDYTAGWSEWSDNVAVESARARGVLAAGLPKYRALGSLAAEGLEAAVDAGGCATFELLLPAHGVALVELPGVL